MTAEHPDGPDWARDIEQLRARLAEKRAELEELRSKLPAHSLRPHQLAEVEDAEDAVSELEAELRRREGSTG
jgi:predicted component of type VI protein secretion system